MSSKRTVVVGRDIGADGKPVSETVKRGIVVAKPAYLTDPQTPEEKKLAQAHAEDHKKTTRKTSRDAKKRMVARGVATPAISVHGNVIPESFRKAYGKIGNCGDTLAKKMSDYLGQAKEDPDKVRELLVRLGKVNEIDVDQKWGARNNGMVRMNLGNVLRARANNGKQVIWGSTKGL